MPDRREPVGLIAGAGRPPFLVARGMRAAGRRVVIVALRGSASRRLEGLADEFNWAAVTRLGRWISALRKARCRRAVMIGAVSKRRIYSPLRLIRNIPDLRTARLFYAGCGRTNATTPCCWPWPTSCERRASSSCLPWNTARSTWPTRA